MQPVAASKMFKPTDKIKSKLSLNCEKAISQNYAVMLSCLFQIYEQKLLHTIGQVREGKLSEKSILSSLTKFKAFLVKDCSLLIDDIWNNYKYYLSQKKRIEAANRDLIAVNRLQSTVTKPGLQSEDKESVATAGTLQLVVPTFECRINSQRDFFKTQTAQNQEEPLFHSISTIKPPDKTSRDAQVARN